MARKKPSPKKIKGLTERQEAFVREYLIDLNATEAYKRAGYKGTGHSAEAAAHRMLRNVEVQAAIQKAIATRAARLEISADKVLQELALIGFADIGSVLDFSGVDPTLRPANEISEAGRKTLASLKVKRYLEGHGDDAREVEVTEFKLWDKLQALANLGKHLGLFPNKIEHTGKDGGPIEIIAVEVHRPPSAPNG